MIKKNVSVILATFNGAGYIRLQLDSILSQTVAPEEIIICDDNSFDDTVNIIKSYLPNKQIKLFINGTRKGVVENFKNAAKLAKPGNWLIFADQDDIWLPQKLSRLTEEMRLIDDDLKPALIFSDLAVIDKNGTIVSDSFWKRQKIKPDKIKLHNLLYGNIVTGCTMIINYTMAEELFLMNESQYLHDEWLALIAYSFGKVSFLRDKLVLYRQHENNVTYSQHYPHAGLIWKVKSDFNYLIGRNKFLKHQFSLANSFLFKYRNRLNSEQISIIEKFIKMENDNYLTQRIKRFISYR